MRLEMDKQGFALWGLPQARSLGGHLKTDWSAEGLIVAITLNVKKLSQ